MYAAFEGFTSTVLVINAHTNAISATIALDNAPEDIAADPATHQFYGATAGGTVLKYSGATNVVTGTASISGLPRGVAANPDTGTAYATVSTGTTGVSLIDEAAATVTGTIQLDDPAGPVAVAADPATDTLVVTAPTINSVFVIPLHAPAFESGGQARFTAGAAGRFTVRATGAPAPAFSHTASLPPRLPLPRHAHFNTPPP